MKQETQKSLSKSFGLNLLPCFLIALFALVHFFVAGPAMATTVYLDAELDQALGVEFSVDVLVDAINDIYGAAYDLK